MRLNALLITILLSGLFNIIHSQSTKDVSFTGHTIYQNFGGASALAVSYVDDDGYPDIICASEYAMGAGAEGISWWSKNADETWTRNIIGEANDYLNIMSLQAVDINNDDNIDILISDWGSKNEIAYFSSDNSNPPNWTKTTIENNFAGAHDAYAAYINDDELIDVVGVAANDGEVKVWYQGNDETWTETRILSSVFDGGRAVYATDIDNDNDIDIIAAAMGTSPKTVLFINQGGSPVNWTTYEFDNTYGGHDLKAMDFDYDNDIDILASCPTQNEIILWKNNGQAKNIEFENLVITGLTDATRAIPCDFDQDGDTDILGTSKSAPELSVWFQAEEPFNWNKLLIDDESEGFWPTYTADIDNDGDIDFVVGNSGTIKWWENNLFSSVSNTKNENPDFLIYPNPSENKISLNFPEYVNYPVNITIYNISGETLKKVIINRNNSTINISDLPPGVIILKMNNENNLITKKLIRL